MTSPVHPKAIRRLPADVAEKIAAGEVIERPFSVVKELVENALDAGARNVTVELENGGLRAVRVIDDGHGIAADEMLVALERHATSKITAVDDLWNLHTLGFRGEALPSIAAISHLTIESRRAGEAGRSVTLEGGKITKDQTLAANAPVPRPSGTRMSVEHLFFNVPARLKFLKSKSSEAGAVRELLERIALCRPDVGFTLLSEGRKTLVLPSAQSAEERFAEVADVHVDSLQAVESEYQNMRVHGFVDRDGRAGNSKQIFLAVNGRMVRDKLVQQAVMTAMRPVMMEGEYPRVFLEVSVAPEDVDVNVHPTKTEVRFRQSRDIFQLVNLALSAVSRAPTRGYYNVETPSAVPINVEPLAPASPLYLETPEAPPAAPQEFRQELLMAVDRVQFRTKPSFTPGARTEQPEQVATARFSKLQYIGQVKNTYLLFQDNDGLTIIDQHAAHERINYEKLKGRFVRQGLVPQPLLMGVTVKCKAEDLALALDHHDSLLKLGFEVEVFGDQHLIIRSAPEGLESDRVLETFNAILETLRSSGDELEIATQDPSNLSARLERMLSTAACHGSVRAGQPLSPSEATALVEQMEETPSSLNCPHGRPASVKLTFAQLENLFKRTV